MNLFKKTNFTRTLFFLLCDVILISLSCWLGFLLRFDGAIPSQYSLMIKGFISLAVPLTIFFFVLERLYYVSWSYISVGELLRVFRAIVASFLGIGAALFIFRHLPIFEGFPRSILFISAFIALLTTGGIRFSKRIYLHGLKRNGKNNNQNLSPILIVGAGEAGEQLVRHILSTKSPYQPVGFIDDDSSKQNILIHGVKILGEINQIPEIIKKQKIQEIIIALPSASKKIIKKTVVLARESGIQKIRILPGTNELLAGKINLSHLRDISIEDLLGREMVQIDTKSIQEYITGKTILVTGAAGSIGSQLCQQICKFYPKKLIALDQRETAVFYLERELNKLFPETKKSFVIADICHEKKFDLLLEREKPEVIFHAAAYKHVPMMETNADEAIRNNILGTLNLGKAALKNKVKKFVMISTDKAINPTSIMGASKRMCEMVCLSLNNQAQKTEELITQFCAVRFGNVLGSQGSVVPVFEEQIKRGGPVEVTHPEMKRYFMVTSEACLLVMQAGAIGQGGEVFVLDMGQPIKIVDLAREMIKLAGFQPDVDIPIVFTGTRPGEKLFEEILTKNEIPTKCEKIFIASLSQIDEIKLASTLKEFKENLEQMNKQQIIEKLEGLVEFHK